MMKVAAAGRGAAHSVGDSYGLAREKHRQIGELQHRQMAVNRHGSSTPKRASVFGRTDNPLGPEGDRPRTA